MKFLKIFFPEAQSVQRYLFLGTITLCTPQQSFANQVDDKSATSIHLQEAHSEAPILGVLTRSKSHNAIIASTNQGSKETTLIPELQENLQNFIQKGGNPIAALVMIEVKSGEILAMVEGAAPSTWGGSNHTALHDEFPSASLFKTVVTSAGIEYAGLDLNKQKSLFGGCAHVNPKGAWMIDQERVTKRNGINLKKAYGHSCNGYFAKIAINNIGLGPILNMASKFRWQRPIPADFFIPFSPLDFPNPKTTSAHTVGKFAAGFGNVGTSAVHAAWRTLAIASGGSAVPLKLFKATPVQPISSERVIEKQTSQKLLEIMEATVRGGTASSAFRGYRFKRIRPEVGGKTGTLTGHSPQGLTTWFIGVYPLSNPEIVVAAVTIIEDLWIFKAHNLAAEAIADWVSLKRDQVKLASKKTNSKRR